LRAFIRVDGDIYCRPDLLILRFRSLAAIGALVTILGLFIDPFLQQIITFEEQQSQALRNATTIPRAVSYSKGNEGSFDLSRKSSFMMP